MKKLMCLLFFGLSCFSMDAQHLIYENFSLNNTEKKEIVNLIGDYINNKKKAADAFSSYDVDTFRTIDVMKEALSLNGSLYAIDFEANVLSIKNEGENYVAQTLLYWHNKDSKTSPITILGIVKFWVKNENGLWKISNYLNYHTLNWSSKNLNIIKFVYYPEFPFDIQQSTKSTRFYDDLMNYFGIAKKDNLTYFIAQNCDDLNKLSGFEYFISEGNDSNICGYFDEKNNIIYSTASFGETHFHEIIHTINKHFPNCNSLLKTGLSSYINDAGTRGGTVFYHIKRFNEYRKTHKVDFENFEDIENVDEYTNASYVIGATLCNAIFRKGGKKLLLEFMNGTKEIGEFKSKLKKEFKIKDFKTFFEKELDVYLKQGKSLLYLEQ